MAKAVRYFDKTSKSARRSARLPGSWVENPDAKARAIASRAAQKAARRAEPRVRKSEAKRVESAVLGRAKAVDELGPHESIKKVVRIARRAVKSVHGKIMGARAATIIRTNKLMQT